MGTMRSLTFVFALAVSFAAHAAIAADSPPPWPRTFESDGNQLVVYQPQMDSWTQFIAFTGHAAVVLTPKGGSATPGVLRFTAQTDVDKTQHTVTLSSITVTD